jgi:hypothetical protein
MVVLLLLHYLTLRLQEEDQVYPHRNMEHGCLLVSRIGP